VKGIDEFRKIKEERMNNWPIPPERRNSNKFVLPDRDCNNLLVNVGQW